MASPVDDSFSVASGGEIRTGYNYPAWRSAMTANTWTTIGNTLSDVDPKNDAAVNPNHPLNSPWNGTGGQQMIVEAWCGAVWDEIDQTLWLPLQGGHADYAGNEPYKNKIDVSSPAWEMLRNPSGAIGNTITLNDGNESTGLYADGRPRAVHSYNKAVYVPGVGPVMTVQGNCSFSGSAGTLQPVFIDPTTGEMTLHGASNANAAAPSGGGAAYDPYRHGIWFRGSQTGFITYYDITANTWTTVGSSKAVSAYSSLNYIKEFDCLLWVNDFLTNDFAVFDCTTGTLHEPSMSGSFVGMSLTGRCQPREFAYGQFALWDNTSDTTVINTISFTDDPRTDTWQIGQLSVDGSNAVTPTAKATNGTYGRFFYSELLDGFGVFNDVTDNIYFYART